jgi:predicted O-methyltransferase YrrM
MDRDRARYWKSAGLDKHIELRLGPAIETLQALPDRPHIDLAFIDADKTSYLDYWEELVPRIRPGGVILVLNVLWSGSVVDPSVTTPTPWRFVRSTMPPPTAAWTWSSCRSPTDSASRAATPL